MIFFSWGRRLYNWSIFFFFFKLKAFEKKCREIVNKIINTNRGYLFDLKVDEDGIGKDGYLFEYHIDGAGIFVEDVADEEKGKHVNEHEV